MAALLKPSKAAHISVKDQAWISTETLKNDALTPIVGRERTGPVKAGPPSLATPLSANSLAFANGRAQRLRRTVHNTRAYETDDHRLGGSRAPATDGLEVERCLAQAIAQAASCHDWRALLPGVAAIPLASPERVDEVARRALAAATIEREVWGFRDVATARATRLGDAVGARAALEAGEAALRAPAARGYEWVLLGQGFVEPLQDEAGMRRCLEAGRDAARAQEDADDLCGVATEWARRLGREGIALLREAEGRASEGAASPWTLANAWRSLGDDEAVHRVLTTALQRATSVAQALHVASAWASHRERGDALTAGAPARDEPVARALAHAQALATTADEWLKIGEAASDAGLGEEVVRPAVARAKPWLGTRRSEAACPPPTAPGSATATPRPAWGRAAFARSSFARAYEPSPAGRAPRRPPEHRERRLRNGRGEAPLRAPRPLRDRAHPEDLRLGAPRGPRAHALVLRRDRKPPGAGALLHAPLHRPRGARRARHERPHLGGELPRARRGREPARGAILRLARRDRGNRRGDDADDGPEHPIALLLLFLLRAATAPDDARLGALAALLTERSTDPLEAVAASMAASLSSALWTDLTDRILAPLKGRSLPATQVLEALGR
ncbi:hypothetical protein OUZ56_032581 [Daphnia magna]|uniref:Uncharacterized protein n=1 Tax=Daphnia magna TaxID=35525 RepID=A0ABR0B9C0_9CRUS|nr:hypothetical protein OUZ56_032581 [Daphnia magna]